MGSPIKKWAILLLHGSVLAAGTLYSDTPTIRVSEVQVVVNGGNTKSEVVKQRLQIAEGREFSNEEDLRFLLERDVQELKNLRIFLDVRGNVRRQTGSAEDYVVVFEIDDAHTFVPIPLLLYDSNAGGFQLLYIQIWDNMFGSLLNWFSIANLTLRSDGRGGIETGPWLFSPKLSNIQIGSSIFAVQIEQERVESKRFAGSVPVSDYRYDRSRLSLEFETRFGAQRRLVYGIEPAIDFRYGYTDFLGSGAFTEIPFTGEIGQSIYYDSVDAFYNSRRGVRAGISTTLKLVNSDARWRPVLDISGEAGYYFAFGERGAISYYPRLSVLGVINDLYENLGEPVRGIPDATMDGNFAVYLNQTLGFSIWRWNGVWNLQIHPWFDMAFASGGTRTLSGWNDIRKSTGMDLLLFIEKVPNLVFRFSWGLDLDESLAWGSENKTEFIVRYSYSY